MNSKKIKLTCGPDNVDAFRTEMKAHCPDFYDLAGELYKRGLLTGLRGATIEIGITDQPEQPEQHTEPEIDRECQECAYWHRDTAGNGTGIGKCAIDSQTRLLKWPKQNACWKFEEKTQ